MTWANNGGGVQFLFPQGLAADSLVYSTWRFAASGTLANQLADMIAIADVSVVFMPDPRPVLPPCTFVLPLDAETNQLLPLYDAETNEAIGATLTVQMHWNVAAAFLYQVLACGLYISQEDAVVLDIITGVVALEGMVPPSSAVTAPSWRDTTQDVGWTTGAFSGNAVNAMGALAALQWYGGLLPSSSQLPTEPIVAAVESSGAFADSMEGSLWNQRTSLVLTGVTSVTKAGVGPVTQYQMVCVSANAGWAATSRLTLCLRDSFGTTNVQVEYTVDGPGIGRGTVIVVEVPVGDTPLTARIAYTTAVQWPSTWGWHGPVEAPCASDPAGKQGNFLEAQGSLVVWVALSLTPDWTTISSILCFGASDDQAVVSCMTNQDAG
jgi:hypothetical protein